MAIEPSLTEVELVAREHARIRKILPNAWGAFFARFGTLRAVQLSAIPPIADGRDVLVTAPTAGGKTEAVVAPICETMIQQKWMCTSVIVVTPTRALVNDLFARLHRPCDEMGIRIGRKTADHSISDNLTERLLVTTPESLESLLTFRKELLEGVRAVVMDEIHLLDGSPRGDQLRIILNRLQAYITHQRGEAPFKLQRVAMSATVGHPARLARAYLGEDALVVNVPGQRVIDAKVIVVSGHDEDRARTVIETAEGFADARKILVFVNSRKQVDAAAHCFRRGAFADAPVFGHHGVLSKDKREEVESQFAAASRAICVSTTTLEVGIDIGDIDLVVCMDPPFSLSSFLQRIGRGCRRMGGLTRVLCVARDPVGKIMFDALLHQASEEMPAGPTAPMRRSVLFQQTIAYLRQVGKHRRLLQQFVAVFQSGSPPPVDAAMIQDVVTDMSEHQILDRQGNCFQLASAGWEFAESRRIYANIRAPATQLTLVDVDSGSVIATVGGVGNSSTGVRVAGKSYTIVAGGDGSFVNVREGGQHSASPMYHASRLPYAFDMGVSIANYLNIESTELVAICRPTHVHVMTWLGKLLNAALAKSFQRLGREAASASFAITLPPTPTSGVLTYLREAVEDALANNPLSGVKVENLVDVGPYFDMLSSAAKLRARMDWLDRQFLEDWINRIQELRVVDPECSLGQTLDSLSRI